LSALDLESEYNNSRRVPEFPAIAARWHAASDAYRARVDPAGLDLAYGEHPRERYDLYPASQDQAPLIVYLHGGGWQEGDRALYAWVAEALVAAGCGVAIPSYPLAPDVSVLEIVDAVRRFLVHLWHHDSQRPTLVGHSAGGHLVAAMLASDWAAVPDVPADLVRAGVAVSGIFDLEPVIATSVYAALGLDEAQARAASPRWWPPPPPGRELVAVVGGQESDEFRRQTRDMADAWAQAGVHARSFEVPAANHFTVIEQLGVYGSMLQVAVLGQARFRRFCERFGLRGGSGGCRRTRARGSHAAARRRSCRPAGRGRRRR